MIGVCTTDYLEKLLSTAKRINRSDIESLVRMPTNKLVELWNHVLKDENEYLDKCSFTIEDPEIDRAFRGEFQLARLLIATALKMKGEEIEKITGQFREEEYQVIMDFEKYKIFDTLSIEQIVEYIRRRKGRVYEFIMEYYRKQYNILDIAWANLLRDMMSAILKRYEDRRKKMEEAVIAYIKRFGLEATVLEIEDVVKKTMEVNRLHREYMESEERLREIEERVAREIEAIRSEFRNIVEAIETGRSVNIEALSKRYEELESRIREYAGQLYRLLEKLGVEQSELEKLRLTSSAREFVEASLRVLENLVDKINSRVREYEALLKTVSIEKETLASRVRELEAIVKGVSIGPVVVEEEARGLVETYLSRIYTRLTSGVEVYNPVDDKRVGISKWDYVEFLAGKLGRRGLLFVKRRGIISKRDYIVVELAIVSHEDSFEKQGFDNRRIGLSEILPIVTDRLSTSVSNNYYHLLVLASPTGFSDRALEFIASSEYYKRFYSKNLTVYLVDLLTGKLHYNDMDKAAESNKGLAEPEYPWESIKRVIDFMESDEAIVEANRRGSPPYLPVQYIVEKTGVSRDLVRVALEELASRGRGRVSRLSSGKTVFVYRGV